MTAEAAAVAAFIREHAALDRIALLQALVHQFPTTSGSALQAGLAAARPRPILHLPSSKRPPP
jgi:hypothetical protein